MRANLFMMWCALTVWLPSLAIGAEPPPLQRLDRWGDPLPEHAIARLGTIRFRPTWNVWTTSISPDGSIVATAPYPGTINSQVEFWDLQSGKRVGELPPKTNGVYGMAWSPNGDRLVISRYRPLAIEIWKAREKERIASLKTPAGWENAMWPLKWSRDGRWIAAIAPTAHEVLVWDAASGETAQRWTYEAELFGLNFSPDSKHLAIAGKNVLELRAVNSGAKQVVIHDRINFWSAALAPDEKSLAATFESGDKQTTLAEWSVTSAEKRGEFGSFDGVFTEIDYTPDGKSLVTNGWRGQLRIWTVATRKLRATLERPGCVGRYFDISRDGKRLISAERRIGIWTIDSARIENEFDSHTSYAFGAELTDDQTVVSAGGDGSIRSWNLNDGRQIGVLATEDTGLPSLALSPDRKMLAAGGLDGMIRLIETSSGRQMGKLVGHQTSDSKPGVFGLAFDAGGKDLYSSGGDGTVRRWDLVAQHELGKIQSDDIVHRVACSPDGRLLAVGTMYRDIDLFELPSMKLHHKIPDSHGLLTCPCAFMPKNSQIVVAGDSLRAGGNDKPSTTLRLWDYEQRKEIWSIKAKGYLHCIAVSADGRLIAAGGSGDYTPIQIWSAAEGKSLLELTGHCDDVRDLKFAPDGKRLVSASQDSTLLVWDVSSAAANAQSSR